MSWSYHTLKTQLACSVLSMRSTYFNTIILQYACLVAADATHVFKYVKPITHDVRLHGVKHSYMNDSNIMFTFLSWLLFSKVHIIQGIEFTEHCPRTLSLPHWNIYTTTFVSETWIWLYITWERNCKPNLSFYANGFQIRG